MATIVVFGGTGYTGGSIVREAASRRHRVISESRSQPGAAVDGERTTTECAVRIVAMENPVLPGEILRADVLADLGLGVGEAAARLGISRVALSRVLHAHARISPNLPVRLEAAGVGTARAWLAMQAAYDLANERAAGAPRVRPLSDVA